LSDTPLTQLARQALESGDPAGLPLTFTLEVLRPYREAGDTLIRTDHAGRLIRLGGFRLDFGIDDGSRTITVLLGDLLRSLPKPERARWAGCLVTGPVSERFLKMKLRPACVDDGELRPVEL
jgi:hypothetical protein